MFTTFRLLNTVERYEVKGIENEIENFDGVYKANVDDGGKKLIVEYNSDATTEDELKEEIEEMGYDISFE